MPIASVQTSSDNYHQIQAIYGFQTWKEARIKEAEDQLQEFKRRNSLVAETALGNPAEGDQAESPSSGEFGNEASLGKEAIQAKASHSLSEEEAVGSPKIGKGEQENLSQSTQAEGQAQSEMSHLADRLRQLEFNLEIAKGLTIHDYFALYLKGKSKDEVTLAVAKLKPSEVSELLMAYKESLFGKSKAKSTDASQE